PRREARLFIRHGWAACSTSPLFRVVNIQLVGDVVAILQHDAELVEAGLLKGHVDLERLIRDPVVTRDDKGKRILAHALGRRAHPPRLEDAVVSAITAVEASVKRQRMHYGELFKREPVADADNV